MVHITKIAEGYKPLTILAKCSILDVWQGSKYTSATIQCITDLLLQSALLRILNILLVKWRVKLFIW